jgi:hypothetical protein
MMRLRHLQLASYCMLSANNAAALSKLRTLQLSCCVGVPGDALYCHLTIQSAQTHQAISTFATLSAVSILNFICHCQANTMKI